MSRLECYSRFCYTGETGGFVSVAAYSEAAVKPRATQVRGRKAVGTTLRWKLADSPLLPLIHAGPPAKVPLSVYTLHVSISSLASQASTRRTLVCLFAVSRPDRPLPGSLCPSWLEDFVKPLIVSPFAAYLHATCFPGHFIRMFFLNLYQFKSLKKSSEF